MYSNVFCLHTCYHNISDPFSVFSQGPKSSLKMHGLPGTGSHSKKLFSWEGDSWKDWNMLFASNCANWLFKFWFRLVEMQEIGIWSISKLFDSSVSWHIPYQQSWFIKFKHGKIWSHPTPGGTRRPHNISNEDIFGPSKNIHKQWKYTCHLSFAFCLPFSCNPLVKTLCPTHFNPVQEAQVLSSTTHSRRSSTTLWDLPSGTHCTDQATTLSLP